MAAHRAAAAEAEETAQHPACREKAGRRAPSGDRHRLHPEDRRAVEEPPRDERLPVGSYLPPQTLEWHARGVWRRLWQSILSELQAEGLLSWERAVVDSSSVRAGHGGEKTGKSPVDRAELGSKHHLLVEGRGVPLSMNSDGGEPPRHHATADARREHPAGAWQARATAPEAGQGAR